jgi:signal transduction histidine kinase/ligand-binding sensor domain-containing protein
MDRLDIAIEGSSVAAMYRDQTNAGVRNTALLLLLAMACRSAFGLDRDRSIDQFFHTAWTVSEGAPSGLTQIVQTADGYLWLGTQTGLVRFDGIRFQFYQPFNRRLPSDTISALLATPDGGLWIGFVPHGAAFLKGNRIVAYDRRDGLPNAVAYAFGRDRDGTVWVGTALGLSRFDGTRWGGIGHEWGFPDETRVDRIFQDHQGRLWVSTLDGLFCLPLHGRRFQRFPGISVRLAESRDGALWRAEDHHGLQPLTGPSASFPSSPFIDMETAKPLIDRDGSMWILTYGDGIARIANPQGLAKGRVAATSNLIQHFTQADGLSDNRVVDDLEDREGNIWVATRGGLDRFRRRIVIPGPFPYGTGGEDLALAAGRDGSIWAANFDQTLMRFQNKTISFRKGLQNVTCAYRDSDGTLWFGGDGLAHLVGNRLESIRLPAEIDPSFHWGVQAITRDHVGDLWISVSQHGVFRMHNGVWTRWGNQAALPRRTAVSIWTDSAGGVWFGYTEDEVALLDGDRVQTFSTSEGLQVGTVTAIGRSHGHIWVGGESGLAIFDGRRFYMPAAEADHEFRGVSGIVETANGDLWLNQATGVAHITSAEIEATLKDLHHPMRNEVFDFRDGALGAASPVRPLPSAVLAGDGHIWVSGTSGAGWIDPARIYRNRIPPPVSVESITADGQQFSPSLPARLPILPSNLRIEYTALSLSIPERVRFRYQLEGFDKGWQDAGTRRSASYTRLGPGHYRFQVIACNNDGVWNQVGAAIVLTVPPAFFQTTWFRVICAGLAIAVLWTLYLLRMRQMASQMQGRLRERLAERERIARELHDTLLQGIQSMILRFQAATYEIPENDPARGMMEQALDDADQVIVEGRERVGDLRAQVEPANALSEALRAAGEELSQGNSKTALHVIVEGIPRQLHPLVGDEAYRIGREALVNAFYHANARKIEVNLAYKKRQLKLLFRDDGCGMDDEIQRLGGRPGHWGLTGMRERAHKMGAHLEISSRVGRGTEIELNIPAAVAYRGKRTNWLSRWWPSRRGVGE